jgi:hypothetical protein
MVEFKPVFDEEEIILYDIYIDGDWYGSRRTMKQAEEKASYELQRQGKVST